MDLDLDFDMLPIEELQQEADHEAGRQRALGRSVALPPELLGRVLAELPTISDYDHRCWSCGAAFRQRMSLARDPGAHEEGCSWAAARRTLDDHLSGDSQDKL